MLSWLAYRVSPFFLGCPGRLSLKACRSSFLWSRLAEDRIVLGDVSWKFGLSLFILGRFFLLGMGLELYMKWAEAVEFFDPTIKGPFYCRILGCTDHRTKGFALQSFTPHPLESHIERKPPHFLPYKLWSQGSSVSLEHLEPLVRRSVHPRILQSRINEL